MAALWSSLRPYDDGDAGLDLLHLGQGIIRALGVSAMHALLVPLQRMAIATGDVFKLGMQGAVIGHGGA